VSTVSVDDLASAINEALQEYRDLAAEDMKRVINEAGKTIRKEIKARAPKESGQYAKSWRVKKIHEDSQTVELMVYSPKRYFLTHLLEHGHAKRNGGRVSARPHIAPAEEVGEEKLMKDLEKALAGH
jgi:hypothetical protein